jgi:hypothetical protein
MPRRRLVLAAFVALLIVSIPMSATAIGRTPKQARFSLWAQLRGDTEPSGGDPNGFGFARVTVDRSTNEVCYRLSVAQISLATAAHIHSGAAGTAGPVVVPFDAPAHDGFSSGCVAVDPALAAQILDNPELFYVNVHNADYPPGAIRGQLRHLGAR